MTFLRKLLLVNSNYISVVILIELSIFDLLNPYKVTQWFISLNNGEQESFQALSVFLNYGLRLTYRPA